MHRRAVIAAIAAWSATASADSLGPVWRIPEAIGQVMVVGNRLVAITGLGLQVIDPHDGKRTNPLAPAVWGYPTAFAVAGGRILVATNKPGLVFGFAAPSLGDIAITPRWQVPLEPGEVAMKIAADPDLTVVEVQSDGSPMPRKRELVAIVGGAIAWRHEVGATWSIGALSVHAGRVVATGSYGDPGALQTFALELDSDGRQRWSYEGDAATGFAAGNRFVAIAHDPYLTIIDRAGGVPFDALIGPLGSPAVTIVDDVAYVTGVADDDKPGGVVAVGLADRRLRWRRAIVPDSSLAIAVSATMVFVQSSADEVVALDRTDGTETWRYGIGVMADLVTIGDRVIAYDSARATAFGPVATAPPVEDAVITGKLTVICTHAEVVTVAGVDTPKRPDGTFRAHIRSRGAISVMALDARLVRVELVGRHRYDVGMLSMDRCED